MQYCNTPSLERMIFDNPTSEATVTFVTKIDPYYQKVREASKISSTISYLKNLKAFFKEQGLWTTLIFDLHVTAEKCDLSSRFNYNKLYRKAQIS